MSCQTGGRRHLFMTDQSRVGDGCRADHSQDYRFLQIGDQQRLRSRNTRNLCRRSINKWHCVDYSDENELVTASDNWNRNIRHSGEPLTFDWSNTSHRFHWLQVQTQPNSDSPQLTDIRHLRQHNSRQLRHRTAYINSNAYLIPHSTSNSGRTESIR